ncbi:hypothetical protein WT71_20000 [Burkholderia stagnalis]|nr:hypothetical protein WT71_20000 [Burkholderia stagnalis]KWI71377.1 hypothetical protein WT73_00985 [Burkholderia stagnalis]
MTERHDSAGAIERAIRTLQFLPAPRPQITDDVALWLAPRTVSALHTHGIHTLADLTVRIPRRRQWWARINGLGATNDYEAVQAWLALHETAATQRAYRKEAERLILWSIVERGRALSSLTTDDAIAYRAFVRRPTPRERWMGPPRPRDSVEWRPFQGRPVGTLGSLCADGPLSAVPVAHGSSNSATCWPTRSLASQCGAPRFGPHSTRHEASPRANGCCYAPSRMVSRVRPLRAKAIRILR